MPPRSCFTVLGALLCVSLVSAVTLDRMSVDEEQIGVPMTVYKPQIRGALSGSAQLGASNLAANLGSSAFDAAPMSLDAQMQTAPAPGSPPLTLEATPLEGDDSSSSGSSSGSMSGSSDSMASSLGSSSFSGSSSGSFSGSSSGSFDSMMSGSSLSASAGSSSGSMSSDGESGGPTPLRCNPAAGPCGGGGPLREAKIVGALTGGGKRFSTVLPSASDIWYFDNGNGGGPPQKPDAPEVVAIQNADPELAQLKDKLEQLVDKMDQEKGWIEDVQSIINHYKQKAGAVAAGLKNESNRVKALQVQIVARKKMAARKALENKLLKVNSQLQQLKSATSSVSGEAKSLTSLKANLNKSIQSIQSEVERLRAGRN